MAYDLQEQEQLAELKAWWSTYGKLILAAVLVGAIGFGGWQAYQRWMSNQALEASAMYDLVQKSVEAKDAAKVKELSATIEDQHPRTIYAAMSALLAAKYYVDAGDPKAAETQLTWIIDKSAADDVIPLARLRLSGLMLDDKRYDDALKVLSVSVPASFEALYADRRGDIYVAQQKPAEARKAYQTAIEQLGARAGAMRTLVQIKLDALGEG